MADTVFPDGAGIDIVRIQKHRSNRSVATATKVSVSVLVFGVAGY